MGDFRVTVHDDRAPVFESIFGNRTVEVCSPWPTRARLPGGMVREVYLLDVKSLTSETRSRLIKHLAATFDLPAEEVQNDLDRDGMPILAQGCSVTIHNFGRWI